MSLKKHEGSVSFDFEWKSSSISLLRCSKSCRLRWTNYFRPGIKRGNFIEHEEKMIIHLQELLGNRQIIALLAYLGYLIDGYQKYWLRQTWGFASELSFYYICG